MGPWGISRSTHAHCAIPVLGSQGFRQWEMSRAMPCRGSTIPWLGSVGVSWLLPCEASAASGSSTLEMAPVWCCRCRVRDLEPTVGSSTPISPPARLRASVKHFHMWQLHVAKKMSQHMAPRCQDEHPAWQGLAVWVESRAVSCGTVLPTPCLVLSAILVLQVAIRTCVLMCRWSSGCLAWGRPGLG